MKSNPSTTSGRVSLQQSTQWYTKHVSLWFSRMEHQLLWTLLKTVNVLDRDPTCYNRKPSRSMSMLRWMGKSWNQLCLPFSHLRSSTHTHNPFIIIQWCPCQEHYRDQTQRSTRNLRGAQPMLGAQNIKALHGSHAWMMVLQEHLQMKGAGGFCRLI